MHYLIQILVERYATVANLQAEAYQACVANPRKKAPDLKYKYAMGRMEGFCECAVRVIQDAMNRELSGADIQGQVNISTVSRLFQVICQDQERYEKRKENWVVEKNWKDLKYEAFKLLAWSGYIRPDGKSQ